MCSPMVLVAMADMATCCTTLGVTGALPRVAVHSPVAGSRCPWRISLSPFLMNTWCLSKVAMHLASQSWPIETNEGCIFWDRYVLQAPGLGVVAN
jgi:hypothetical protein